MVLHSSVYVFTKNFCQGIMGKKPCEHESLRPQRSFIHGRLRGGCIFLLLSMMLCTVSLKASVLSEEEVKVMASDRGLLSSEPELLSGTRGTHAFSVKPGASRTNLYLHDLKGKSVGVVANQTSIIPFSIPVRSIGFQSESFSQREDFSVKKVTSSGWEKDTMIHLVDMLLDSGIKVSKVFSPEHGFRGQAEAGARVNSGVDSRTGLPVVSLYGSHKKPSQEDLEGIDVMLFDLQDVGVRFYTYISTLHYVMEACAENGIRLIVLDRPNPHISYVDGPVLDTSCCRSFVGMHPVPVIYGMTIGEYARMINGEKWLAKGIQCDLEVVPLAGYTRDTRYSLPVPPSPNLRSMRAIYVYPSLCFFEGTPVSVGRGTMQPFECAGFPGCSWGGYRFTPRSIPGMSAKPPFEGKECQGIRVEERFDTVPHQLELSFLLEMYKVYPDKNRFFNPFFDKLAGTSRLREQICSGCSEVEIRNSWQSGLEAFRLMRQPYLLYQ